MVNLGSILISFFKLGLTAFGGPAMVAYIKEMAVNNRQWIDEETFNEGVALAQAIPGATAMQVAAYVGFKTRGILGGLASYIGFGLPAFILMVILSFLYEKTYSTSAVLSIFTGLQVIVVAIVANSTLSFAKPIYKSIKEISIAFLAFILFVLKLNPFLIIILCFFVAQIIFKNESYSMKIASKKANLKGLFILFVIFCIFVFSLFFIDKTLFTLAITMAKIDLFAFGGGYTSLPLMLYEFVERFGWINYKTFMDGIALGQITPGPIVITATFVGFLVKGVIGALVSTISVFTPSFLIITFASEISGKISNSAVFIRAKKGLLASFSGLLLFATLKFANAVNWDLIKLSMFLISFFCLFKKINIFYVVVAGSIFSVIFFH